LRLMQGERAEIVVDLACDERVILQATPKTVSNASRATVDLLQITTTGTGTPDAGTSVTAMEQTCSPTLLACRMAGPARRARPRHRRRRGSRDTR